LKISHNSPPNSWPVCFTVGAKRHFWGLSPPSPCLAAPLVRYVIYWNFVSISL